MMPAPLSGRVVADRLQWVTRMVAAIRNLHLIQLKFAQM